MASSRRRITQVRPLSDGGLGAKLGATLLCALSASVAVQGLTLDYPHETEYERQTHIAWMCEPKMGFAPETEVCAALGPRLTVNLTWCGRARVQGLWCSAKGLHIDEAAKWTNCAKLQVRRVVLVRPNIRHPLACARVVERQTCAHNETEVYVFCCERRVKKATVASARWRGGGAGGGREAEARSYQSVVLPTHAQLQEVLLNSYAYVSQVGGAPHLSCRRLFSRSRSARHQPVSRPVCDRPLAVCAAARQRVALAYWADPRLRRRVSDTAHR